GQIGKMVDLLSQEAGVRPEKIGIGTPGSIDPPTGLMKNSNTTVLNGQPFRRDIQKTLGIEVRMANDANCFAIAEALLGAGQAYSHDHHLIFGVIMGTGVGGGIVINGQAWDGGQGIGGEWGHSFLDESGGECYCGKVGCVERIIAGPHLERFYLEQSGQKRKLSNIIAAYEAGTNDPHVLATVDRLLHFFGKGMANIINILDPTAIILGGGLSNIDLLYSKGVEKIRDFVFNPTLHTPVLRPQLGDSAGVFGAAMLV
ncbi:MAG: ROK family protein, partial [Bacteroidota bacterium]